MPDRLKPPLTIEEAVFPRGSRFIAPCATHADEISDETWRQADAVLLWHDVHLGEAELAKLDRCKVVVRIGVGFDNVDLQAASARGVVVCNVPDYGVDDVADHTVGLYLALSRGLFRYDALVRAGDWSWDGCPELKRVSGSSVGVIGLGRIGTAVALRLRALGVRVVFHDPYKADGYDKALNVHRAETLAELLESCDAVTIHTPLTAETTGMVDDAFVGRMRGGSILLNTSRGGVMDIDAVWRGLCSGRLRAVGLDVLPQEPPPSDHPLVEAWRRPGPDWIGRIVITPHAAFFNQESYAEMRRKAAEEALRVLEGGRPRNQVN
jgi:lactate dehydrogenase-like 2-hydroxyacid dehydrogenase